mmetsp:Transcript_19040/g.31856  ORF Transcript_19040/g.31856 Transcript_19040/m.31856 type:complete len:269 (-) Transcript_19040:597-1403(-)|eukprot:CAMPEP_0174970530 /NCGR_PEP_ID=MMETSP0004_2-20121128/9439_1 /TAXON_ID=420556 /ORGANISM="Ochromonas sp., Strain CCMP1393" /LENGTH=268 /DNA_ID=CAMNT_0016220281 /DNA_START=88 /DNA_END=894 /DNA_ORIENTATION=+
MSAFNHESFDKTKHLQLPFEIRMKNPLISEPFPFLTTEGLALIRTVLKDDLDAGNCIHWSKIAPAVHRGLQMRSAFVRDLWNAPEIAEGVSSAMGVEVCLHKQRYEQIQFNRSDPNNERDTFNWHFDSQPYTMIVLVSDPAGDCDANTKFRYEGKEDSLKFPAAGYAYIINGVALEHMVTGDGTERISMVVTFQFKDPFLMDKSNMVLGLQYTPDKLALYADYINYRLQRMREVLASEDHSAEEKNEAIASIMHHMQVETNRFTPSDL